MKRFLFTVAVMAGMSGAANSQTIGVSAAAFDDRFLDSMRGAMQEHASSIDGVTLVVRNADNDVGSQLSNVQEFIEQGVDAIVVTIVDADSGAGLSAMAEDADIPLVYINREPSNVDDLPFGQAFVASNEIESGTLSAFEVCKELRSAGKSGGADVVILMGDLSSQAAIKRTEDVNDVVGMAMCNFMNIVEAQTANWSRSEAHELISYWIESGLEFDAVLANNDEMAIGAINAIKDAGIDMDDVIIGGVDATDDALQAMRDGDLKVTVFQDARGQGVEAINVALELIEGNEVETLKYVPFKLVTTENMDDFDR